MKIAAQKNPRLRIPTLSPEFYDIDISVSRGQTFHRDFLGRLDEALQPRVMASKDPRSDQGSNKYVHRN